MNYLDQTTTKDDYIIRGLWISFVLHALILAFFTLKTVFFEKETIDFSQAVRVDIVGLPEKIDPKKLPPAATEEVKQEKKNPEPVKAEPRKPEPSVPTPQAKTALTKTPSAPSAPSEDGVNLEKVKNKQQSAIEKLKAMAALEKIKQEVVQQASAQTGKPVVGGQKIKGNILSPGTDLRGLAKLQQENYVLDLDRHIKRNWALPEWLAQRDFKAQARLYIDSRGNILERKIVKSSGNPSYDEEVLSTIDRSAPFPIPPEKFLAIFSVDGILIGFPE